MQKEIQDRVKWFSRTRFLLRLLIFSIAVIGIAIFLLATKNNWLNNEYSRQEEYLKQKEIFENLGLYIKTAESDSRGYALSGDKRFIEKFNPTIDSIHAIALQLQSLENVDVKAKNNFQLQKLGVLTQQKTSFMQRVNALSVVNRPAANSLIATAEGLRLSDSITAISQSIIRGYKANLKQSLTNSWQVRYVRNNIAFFSIALSILLIILSFYLLLKEINKVKELSKKLKLQKEHYRTTLSSIGEGLITTGKKGEIIYMNPAAEWMTGWKNNEARNLPLEDIYDVTNEETGRPFKNIVSRILVEGKTIELENNTILTTKGSDKLIISNSVSPLFDVNGDIAGTVLVFNDITEKKGIENKLKEREQQYRDLIQNLPEAVYTCDELGYIQLYNSGAVALWGQEPVAGKEQWCGSWKIFNTDGSDLPIDICPMAIALKEGRPVRGEQIMIQRPDGSYRHVLPYPTPLFDANGKLTGAVNMLIDLTDKKEKEILIKKTEEKYRNLIEQASDGIVIYSFDGTIYDFNKAAYMQTGYTSEEFEKLKLLDLLFDEPVIINPDNAEKIKAGETVLFTRRMKRKNGSALEIEINARMLADGRNLAFIRDITERKKAEGLIRKEKELSDSIINSLPGIFYLFDANRNLLRWNKNFETVSGYSAGEVCGIKPIDFYEGEGKKLVRENFEKILQEGKSDFEANFVTKAGDKIPYYFTGLLVQNEGNPCIIGTGIDISERKKSEQQLQQSYDELRQLAIHLQDVREEERASMAREIHDELGQQLTGLKMDVSGLTKKLIIADEEIKQKTDDINGLIDKMVITVRKLATDLRPSILDDIGMAEALDWYSQEFEKRYRIQTIFNSALLGMKLNNKLAIALFRIYQESLTNVARHSGATKIISSFELKNNHLILIISDNGKGFDINKESKKKTLGLLGMKERTIMTGGEYTISSKPGKGTTVSVIMPLQLQS